MRIDYLKELLFDEFEKFEDYEFIIDDIRDLHSGRVITDEEYDFILQNYNDILREWENKQ